MKKVVIAGGQNIGSSILEFIIHQTDYEVSFVIARTDDKPNVSAFPSLVKKAKKYGIETVVPSDVNSSAVMEKLINSDSDIIISAMYNRIFKKQIIDLMNRKLGIVNIHYAPLPKYSGFWPEMWAIWLEEKEFGVTFHYIDNGIDTGDIINQEKFTIDPNETRHSLYEKCDDIALRMFVDNHSFIEQRVQAVRQDVTMKTFFKKELPNNGIIDLDWDKRTIERYIRATSFYPYVNAKIRVDEKVYSVVDEDLPRGIPIILGRKK